MFKKPLASHKPWSPLKNSERRKLAEEIAKTFAVSTELARLLVPDGILTSRGITHLDESVTLYACHLTADLPAATPYDPLWFRIGKSSNDLLVPSVYTLLRYPALLSIIVTAPMVIDKLAEGADLFRPGVNTSCLRRLPPAYTEGTLVAVSSGDDSERPCAVGQLSATPEKLARAATGKVVITLHAEQDHLWMSGTQSEPQRIALPTLEAEAASLALDDSVQPEEVPEALTKEAAVEPAKMLPVELVDALLEQALCYAVVNTLPNKSQFPLSASVVYSAHILPARPAAHADHIAQIDVKRSSHKTLAKFLKAMAAKDLLTLKEMKPEALVLSINKDAAPLKELRPYKTMAKLTAQARASEAQEAKEEASASSISVTDVYKPHGQTVAFFEKTSRSKDPLTAAQARKALIDYVDKEKLIHPVDPKFISIDPLLGQTLLKSNENVDAIDRSDAIHRLLQHCQKMHRVQLLGGKTELRKGTPTTVKVEIKARQGRKVVSIITGLELYGFLPERVSSELQVACASSTSVDQVFGSKKGAMEVLVQGDQSKTISDYLEVQGLPKQLVEVIPLQRKKK
ncbi:uncharacterized protein L969DRAFT_95351 [Mixia osmundae IAM 14324]|uniref:SUI1 domain-containing protein n=1 Tax=Mixia osmundae (strain CBS 9802 / IAM 14324 / JCM 22182 / KY 12970) TaxID=764103 RepID=G7DZ42_MIXOS|nr:uncharacterized protein L969DRAFT_95351 [Mixia osmundae IAM 14324]KEI38253.1 hypothetical protein L969DRAFT_95351 [Mixia osmundae IAM 14324]GAA95852.1 hypothetical protein E5Q_02509 [Mixia osmundae IAM 14324]